MTGQVILLNGVGSVGKSSLAKALQQITTEPFLHVQMDTFLEMLPDKYHDHPHGFVYEATHDRDGKATTVVHVGAFGRLVLHGMRQAIAAMAHQDLNLIVDDVMEKPAADEYSVLLSDVRYVLIGLFAPLEVIEERELHRGDRMIGLARGQYDAVHKGMRYDLEIDTTSAGPSEWAAFIKDKYQL